MRSPYSYLALNRILEIQRDYHVEVNLCVVYPIAIRCAGMNADEMMCQVSTQAADIETNIQASQAAQDTAGHGGVPSMVFKGEPFVGQDRIDLLLWCMKQHSLTARKGKGTLVT